MMNEKVLEVWSIRDATERNPRSHWKHAGRAFVNQDGSINVLLDVLPLEGKLQIRKKRESDTGDFGRNGSGESAGNGHGGGFQAPPSNAS